MTELPFRLERTILIRARRATVFRYFTDSERFATWWGAGSSIDPKPGGAVLIRYPGGSTASGKIVEIVDGERIVFSYGYDDPAKSIPPGASLVTILLRDVPGGTELELRHDVHDEKTREQHVLGWRFQLSLFANVVANDQHAALSGHVAGWFSAWSAADLAASLALLERSATPDVWFRDAYACLAGARELAEHIHAARVHMPGLTLVSDGPPRACQGVALADYRVEAPNGATVAKGTNVLELAPDGKIAGVTGVPRIT